MSNVVSGSGSSLYVSQPLPATEDALGFEALTWTLVTEVTDIGEYGKEWDSIDHAPIDTRKIETIKGNYRNGGLPLTIGSVPADPGQLILLTANDVDADISFKIDRNDGQIDYVIGKVFSYKPSVSGGSVLSIACQVTFNGEIIPVTV